MRNVYAARLRGDPLAGCTKQDKITYVDIACIGAPETLLRKLRVTHPDTEGWQA